MKMTRISVGAVAWFTMLAAQAKSPPGPTLAEHVAKAAPPMVKVTREEAEAKALGAAQALLKDKPSHLRALRQDGPATLAGMPGQPTWSVGFMADNGRTGIGIRVTVDAVTGEAKAEVAQAGR